MTKLTDIFGVEAKEGDKIAVAMAYGKSSVLRIGEILFIKDNDDARGRAKWSVRIKWSHNGRGYNCGIKESSILVHSHHSYAKFVILPAGFVNKYPADIEER